ncbi:uncharacterized protein KY384_007583 [Bacidia gigantensis]|uniref:uncharacterized protein n=1 Tax=Bacidia gigantensis TaxID=2732470 RepID=UPI001D048E80|nr:uncharacterized protein KY384_007583 [Bacidia gigantensis]KAG8527431.1 hypothetical protein KY384_007583 [Bacidia gigantensis]
MLRDDRFSTRAKVDRYGRRLPKEKVGRNRDLERFYRAQGKLKPSQQRLEIESVTSEEEKSSSSDDDVTSSSEDEGSLDNEEEEIFGILQQQDAQGNDQIPDGEISRRLAVVNLDWDNVRAADLMAVLNSFIPSGRGRIERVSIYPSEFGKERMEREETEGPPKEIFSNQKQADKQLEEASSELEVSDDKDEDLEEGSVEDEGEGDEEIKESLLQEDSGKDFNSAHLRRYQLERLRYYYAVIKCSSADVAQTIYEAVDGTEYLSTANFFDLRYISDETDFSEDRPRDECKRVPDGYKPTEFVTDALQHSKVRLTWDADDTERKEAQKRAFTGGKKNVDDNDLKAYLGSDTSEDEEPALVEFETKNSFSVERSNELEAEKTAQPKLSKKETERRKMRALLGLPSEPASAKAHDNSEVSDMQVTFTSGLSSDKKGSVFENTPEEAQETTVEKYIRREKERKARRKDKMKSKRTDPDVAVSDDDQDSDAVDTGKARRQNDASNEANEDLGFDDPFFTNETRPPAKIDTKKSKKKRNNDSRSLSPPPQTPLDNFDTPNNNDDDNENHFSLPLLNRAQKLTSNPNSKSKKRKLKHHLSDRDRAALAAQQKDTFEINVEDERFRGIFERPEFAVDPSHSRFMGTEGMGKVLEKVRKGREDVGRDDGTGRDRERGEGGAKGDKRNRGGKGDRGENGVGEGEIERLVKRVKGHSSGK